MFSHLATLFRSTPCVAHRASRCLVACRTLSSSSAVRATGSEPTASFDDFNDSDAGESEGGSSYGDEGISFQQFLNQEAWKFRVAEPNNWLARGTPFPMNPSFRPPPPIADSQRELMYRQYMSDPEVNNVRALSQRFNLSIKRVDAILRLKGLERAWKKGKQLQTGFLAGMEHLLGATTHKAVNLLSNDPRYNVQEADVLEQDEHRDASRQRYQRLYWESVTDNGSEPIVPGTLEHARDLALQFAKRANAFKAIPELMPRVPDTEFMKRPKEKVVRLDRPGRTTLEFVDVGAKFMDVNERIRRIAAAGRKSRRRRTVTEDKHRSLRKGNSFSS